MKPLPEGLTPLMYASVSGNIPMVFFFLFKNEIFKAEMINCEQPGTIDFQENVLGMTALMFAIVSG